MAYGHRITLRPGDRACLPMVDPNHESGSRQQVTEASQPEPDPFESLHRVTALASERLEQVATIRFQLDFLQANIDFQEQLFSRFSFLAETEDASPDFTLMCETEMSRSYDALRISGIGLQF